ncbi:hypothetical protein TrCOL_g639 [Triparma columacea]|uniref:Uncharacterized protein n=1 Tax=Triparma columacea TaxID=722753 RepID=A0A9W7LDS4_9STRA|nr:hypothetical protein TrCOL_g639 [Triparma columacea]
MAAAGLFSLICIAGGGVIARQILLTKAGEKIVAALRTRLFENILRQEAEFFDKTRTGDLVTRLTADVQLVQSALTTDVVNGVRSIIMVAGGSSLLLVTSPTLTAISLISLPPVFMAARHFGAQIKKLQKEVQEELGMTTTKAEEVISNLKTVRSFNGEILEAREYEEKVHRVRDRAIAAGIKGAYLDGSVHVAANAGLFAILAVGSSMVGVGGGGEITPGDLASFLMYSLFVAGNVASLSTLYGSLQKTKGAAGRIFELIDREPLIQSGNGELEGQQALGVSFQNVGFAYPTRGEVPVLNGVNLEFPPGSHTALVGSSGCGKSTMGALLLRLYDTTEGSIRVGGEDIRDLQTQALREKVAVVQQEPVLFAVSIKKNIAYGRSDATEEEILQAADAAKVTDFAKTFPEGLDTMVGERGVKLSGGQKQKVAVARVLLRQAPIVLFDEATSALDAESEHAVSTAIGSIESLYGNKTTIISVAHRLSTILRADRVAVLEGGRIVELLEGDIDVEALMEDPQSPFGKLIRRQKL